MEEIVYQIAGYILFLFMKGWCKIVDNKVIGKRYLVIPGTVTSKDDGEHHFVSASELMKLYGVDPAECTIVRRNVIEGIEISLDGHPKNLIQLSPREDGNYSLS